MFTSTGGIELLVRVDVVRAGQDRWHPDILVDRAVPLTCWPRDWLRRPTISREDLAGGRLAMLGPGDAELEVRLLDAGAFTVGRSAWPARESTYQDWGNPDEPGGVRFRVACLEAGADVRVLRLPLLEETDCLAFWLNEVIEDATGRANVRIQKIAVYPLFEETLHVWQQRETTAPVRPLPGPWPRSDDRQPSPRRVEGGRIVACHVYPGGEGL